MTCPLEALAPREAAGGIFPLVGLVPTLKSDVLKHCQQLHQRTGGTPGDD